MINIIKSSRNKNIQKHIDRQTQIQVNIHRKRNIHNLIDKSTLIHIHELNHMNL